MKDKSIEIVGNGSCWILTAVQSNELFQWISFSLSIVATLLTISYNIYKWYKEAKKDGNISQDEINQVVKENKGLFTKLLDLIGKLFTKKGKKNEK